MFKPSKDLIEFIKKKEGLRTQPYKDFDGRPAVGYGDTSNVTGPYRDWETAIVTGKHHHLPEAIDYNNIPGCTYCIPEISSVGYTEKAAKEAGYEIKVGKFPFVASGKASAAGATEGFVKVIYDAKYGEFLGCHMIGYNVTEMIAEAVVARKLETTAHEILNAVHPHPTMSEGLKEATAAAYGEAIDI